MSLKNRIAKLEARSHGLDTVFVVGIGDHDGEYLEEGLASAHAQAGPDDLILTVTYEKEWRGESRE